MPRLGRDLVSYLQVMGLTDEELAQASQRAESSLEWARQLLADGYPSPSLVWSVRAVEIFLKEFVLAAVYMRDNEEMTWERAVRKASALFEKLKWKNAFKKMNEEFGPLDPMLTRDGRDVLSVWDKEIVVARHNIVHGREEAAPEFAVLVFQWAEQILVQLKLRFITAGKHPLSDTFMETYRKVFEAHHGHPPPKADEAESLEEGNSDPCVQYLK